MNCPIQNNNSEILLDYCSRGLSHESTLLVEAHIETCVECKSVTASQAAVWDALDLWEAEPVSADFDRRLYERIERRNAGLWARLSGFASGIHLRPVFTLGAACATIILAMVLSVPSMNFFNQSDAIRIETSEIEQAERVLDDIDMLNNLGVVAMSPDFKQERKTL